MYHPKHWAELDPFTANDNPSFRNILFDGDNKHLRRDGLSNQPTSIRVMTGDDKEAAGEVACRIIRIWNLFRDIPDDELGDVVLIKRSGVKDMAEHFKTTMDEIADGSHHAIHCCPIAKMEHLWNILRVLGVTFEEQAPSMQEVVSS